MKAWMSAADIDYRHVHDLQDIAERILSDAPAANSLAGAQLRILMGYTTFVDLNHPGEYDNWLTKYAVIYRYEGTGFHMDNLEKEEFGQRIVAARCTFVNRSALLKGQARIGTKIA